MTLSVCHPHQRRLATRFGDTPDLVSLHQACIARYERFLGEFMDALEASNVAGQIEALDAYRVYAKEHENQHAVLNTRSKYYSTILEELPVLLTEDLVRARIEELGIQSTPLHLGAGKNCVIRIAANPDGTVFHERKLIDFALSVDADRLDRWVPLVGLEVKKYVDKTMFGSIMETFKSLQVFRPRTYYGFLVEDEARGQDVVTNSQMYRNEFLLTQQCRNASELHPTDQASYERFVEEIRRAISDGMSDLRPLELGVDVPAREAIPSAFASWTTGAFACAPEVPSHPRAWMTH